MDVQSIAENVKSLSAKAALQTDGGDAMRFSQAACNLANALCALKSSEDIGHGLK